MHIADADPNGNAAESYTHGYRHSNAYPDSSAFTYTYSAGYGYTYRIAKLHTELQFHIGDRNDRAGSHGHWKPLR